MSTRPPSFASASGDGDLLRWSSHPLRDEPAAKSGLLIGILAALTAAVDLTFPGHLYSVLTFGLLTGCLSRYFAPTRYACGPDGLVTSHLGRRRTFRWTDIGRVVPLSGGLFISPFAAPSRLDRFRGSFIRTPGNRESVVACVEQWMHVHKPSGIPRDVEAPASR